MIRLGEGLVRLDADLKALHLRWALIGGMAVGDDPAKIEVDLFFASSGVEQEIVDEAELQAILPGIHLPVATTPHLLALKVLAGRDKDRMDVRSLLARASPREIQQARETMTLIQERGFHRGKDLLADFAKLMEPEA
ncbi:MAG TPA: hypothetical protein VGK45_17250 [Thermoanaerobaculia bacterium]